MQTVARRGLLALLLAGALAPAPGECQERAGIVTTLQGEVTAARAGQPRPVALKFRDDVFLRDSITTAEQSLARLLLGGKAVVTIRERSRLTITEVPGEATVNLESGKIALIVATDRLRPGERLHVRTPNAVAGVRGTVLIAEVFQAQAQAQAAAPPPAVTTRFSTLSGLVEVFFADPSGALTRRFVLGANEYALGTGSALPRTGTMTPQERAAATGGLDAEPGDVAEGASGAAKDVAIETTVATFSGTILGAGLRLPPPSPQDPRQVICPTCQEVAERQGVPPPPPPPAKPTGVLVFGDYASGRAAVSSDLAARGATVTMNVAALPADLSAFGTIWHVSQFTGLSEPEQAALQGFLGRGGGLHLTGERGDNLCCLDLNASVVQFLNRVVDGGGIDRTAAPFGFGPAAFNPAAAGGVTTTPNTLVSWFPNASGNLVGVAGDNVLVTGDGLVLGGVFDSDDLAGDRGRLTVLMDSNWLDRDDQGRADLIENLHAFIDDPPFTLSLDGPLFRSAGESLDSGASPTFAISGYTIVGRSGDPLVWLRGTELRTGALLRLVDSAVVTSGVLARLEDGARLVQSGDAPVVWASGSALAVGGLFDVRGRADRVAGDARPDPVTGAPTGLVLGSDRPLQPGPGAAGFRADRGTTAAIERSAYRIDTALLEATAPLLEVLAGSAVSTGRHAIDLAGRARLEVSGDGRSLVRLDGGRLAVQGSLVYVAGGSRLGVGGDLVAMSGGSVLVVRDGVLLDVRGGSIADIRGALVRLDGSGNVIAVTNNVPPRAIINGVPVGGQVGNVRITGDALAGLGTAGTITVNGVELTGSTPLSSLSGSLVVVRRGGSVRIGD